jgi:hypothetical protein
MRLTKPLIAMALLARTATSPLTDEPDDHDVQSISTDRAI